MEAVKKTIRPRRMMAALMAAGLLCALGVVLLGGGHVVLQGPVVRGMFSGKIFWLCATILVGGSAVLAVLGTILWQAGAAGRRQRRDSGEQGAAILEFAMVLPIALMMVLMMTQASLLWGGNLCVQYASYTAARSAIVTIPQNLSITEPANVVEGDVYTSDKIKRIHQAAAWAIMPVACSDKQAPEGDVADFQQGLKQFFAGYGLNAPGWVNDNLGRRYQYALDHTDIELSPPADSNCYARNEDIRVTVRHTFYLAVPYASYVFAHMDKDGVTLPFGTKEYGTKMESACSLTNEGETDYIDVEPFPQKRP